MITVKIPNSNQSIEHKQERSPIGLIIMIIIIIKYHLYSAVKSEDTELYTESHYYK